MKADASSTLIKHVLSITAFCATRLDELTEPLLSNQVSRALPRCLFGPDNNTRISNDIREGATRVMAT